MFKNFKDKYFIKKEDININIDKNILDAFPDINSLTCWEHIELWATIKNISINKDFVYFITIGGIYYKKIYDIILDAIKTTNILDNYINDINFVKLIYQHYSTNTLYNVDAHSSIWSIYTLKQMICTTINSNQETEGTEKYDNRKYNLFSALNIKFPILLIKFYDKHKKILHDKDETFINWLISINEIRARHNKIFAELHNAFIKEVKNQRNIKMHLN